MSNAWATDALPRGEAKRQGRRGRREDTQKSERRAEEVEINYFFKIN